MRPCLVTFPRITLSWANLHSSYPFLSRNFPTHHFPMFVLWQQSFIFPFHMASVPRSIYVLVSFLSHVTCIVHMENGVLCQESIERNLLALRARSYDAICLRFARALTVQFACASRAHLLRNLPTHRRFGFPMATIPLDVNLRPIGAHFKIRNFSQLGNLMFHFSESQNKRQIRIPHGHITP